jgi:rfaE bifunctional protein nucleotidyltransferase chain/domain
MASAKIIPYAEAPAFFERLRASGKRLVQCHGTFDLLHPGHIVHLEDARKLGDVLVVTVTDEKHVNKGPGRPYFNDVLRTRTLAALECVDHVVLIPHTAAVEAIETVKPHIYCKGTEYADASTDVTGNIHDDVSTVRRHGGEVRYIGDVVFSSTRLLNRHFDSGNPEVTEFCQSLAGRCTPQQLADAVNAFSGLRVLVVGDTIFDKYTFVKVQGLTSKNRIISGRYLEEEAQAGGALAVYRHIKQFTPNVRLLSLLGTEAWLEPTLRLYLPREDDATIRSAGLRRARQRGQGPEQAFRRQLPQLRRARCLHRLAPCGQAARGNEGLRHRGAGGLRPRPHAARGAGSSAGRSPVSRPQLPDELEQPRVQHHFPPIPAR